MIPSIRTVPNSHSAIPYKIEMIEFIQCGECIRCFLVEIRISKVSSQGSDSFRITCFHSQKSIIQQMHSPVGHQSTCIIPEPSEIKEITAGIKCSGFCRSKPHFIIDRKSTRLNSSHDQ